MSLIFFEDVMEEQIRLIPEIAINANLARRPSFGWGSSADLRKFLAHHKEQHNPLVWSVPKPSGGADASGMFTRAVELNLCVVESNVSLLNEQRMRPDKSFKAVLSPLWDQIERRMDLSNITMIEDEPKFFPIPNFMIGDDTKNGRQRQGQYIWDVLKLSFTVNYSKTYTPCNNN